MDGLPLLPGMEALACEQVSIESGQIVVHLRRTPASACCPKCHH